MRYQENCIAYELGHFLLPRYPGYENCDTFFLLLQNTTHDLCADTFSVKLGKTRYLEENFYSDCLKVLVYLEIDGGRFSIYDIKLSEKKDGTKFFDAPAFLEDKGIEYEPNDTTHYRYFKSRLHECRVELILENDDSKFSVIRRRINADDIERLKVYRNASRKSILQQGYFLLSSANDGSMNYHSVEYFQSEKDLLEYIRQEYGGTAANCVTKFSISELLKGKTYKMEHRQGTNASDVHIVLVHDENLQVLYRFLDRTVPEDNQGAPVQMSEWIKSSKTPEEIMEIIEFFNEAQNNYW